MSTWSHVARRVAARRASATVAGLSIGWLAFCLMVWAFGASPRAIAVLLFEGTWGTTYGAGQVLFKATPLLFTALAVDVGLRAGLFNIGADGQLAIASLATAAVGAALPAGTPAVFAVPVCVLTAGAAGAAWALVPALLKARFEAHEVITTIMMNRIADGAVGIALTTFGLALAGSVRTRDVVAGARIPRLDVLFGAFHGSAASFALLAGLALALVLRWSYRRSRVGRELVLIGQGPSAMIAEGVPVRRRYAQALVASGCIAGLASLGTVLGYKGYFEEGLGAGAGFGGIAVALLGRGNAVGIVLAALLFGTLAQGGLAVNAFVPKELMDLLAGIIVTAVAVADARAEDRR